MAFGPLSICNATVGLIDSLRNKLEVHKLEQKYTRRSKRTTFISTAQYVDGEYVYNSGNGSPLTLNSTDSSNSNWWGEKREPSPRTKQIFKRQSVIF